MAGCTAALAPVVVPATLSSGYALRASPVQCTPILPAASRVHRCVSTRASLSEEQRFTRRNVLATVLGAGAALGFAGQALAANPGSLARQRKVEKPEKPESKKSEEANSPVIEVEAPKASPPEVPTSPEVSKSPEVSSLSEARNLPDVPSVSEPPSIPNMPTLPELPSLPEVPSMPELPTIPEIPSPAPQAEVPSYADDFDIGQYFKDLF
ncbi:hypothetical protein MPTK1_2g02000 [Marchantia polymorpha subsp. ruderalis]|uniref:Uncharacterized protein n=2 Tax=Marchantia polymorpha TaxID=3197 RepID=A0A176W8Y7_MARPO|nr:hypothetical protein AXG93_684s1420 [Marchantia polymorpha subsp. ruderalis]PTQ30051.1 hypothetical protein MARPO_0130s0008 [Marchantia polymorpha]BBN00774.1 hypothetical protein Mp_2g02000 [Marchantia polymorpha subsp. ruderalis]|eukprot:PTQ30051.1 hypothetical protein MARPO_0130s0008 [Marchantia polymorpha]